MWQGVQLPSADLGYSVLARTNLSKANLQGVNFVHAVLRDTDLTGADLRNVIWGEEPYLHTPSYPKVVAYHPREPWFAVTQGSSIELRHCETAERISVLECHNRHVTSLMFSHDGQQLVSGSEDGTVRLWDIATKKPLWTLPGQVGAITTVAISSKNQIAFGGQGNTIRLCTNAGEMIAKLEGMKVVYITSIAFHPDGQRLVFGSINGGVGVWDLRSESPISWINSPQQGVFNPESEEWGGVRSVVFSPDGRLLAYAWGRRNGNKSNTAQLWDVIKNVPLGQPLKKHTDAVTCLAFSPNSQQLISGSVDQLLLLWDTNTQKLIEPALTGHSQAILSVAFNPSGKQLVSGSGDLTVRFWDLAQYKSLKVPLPGHTRKVSSIAFQSNGRLLASASYDSTIRLWDPATQEMVRVLKGHRAELLCVAFNFDGSQLISGSVDGTVCLWDVATGKLISQCDMQEGLVTNVAFSPNGQWLALSTEQGIWLWSVSSQMFADKPKRLFDPSEEIQSLVFSPNSQYLAWGGNDKKVWLLAVVTDKPMVPQLLTTHKDYVLSIAFGRDSQSLAVGSEVGNVELWDITNTTEPWVLKSWPAHPRASVTSVAFSPDGLFFASGGLDGTVQLVQLLNRKNFQFVQTLGWGQLIWSIAFTNDRWPGLADDEVGFAIGDEADTVSFWALSSKKGKMRFFGMPSHFAMTLQADGAKIADSKMSMLSSRLLNQYGVQGEADIVEEVAHSASNKTETKSASDSKIETKATVIRTPPATSQSTSFTSSGGPGHFAPKINPVAKPDAKAQILLIELYGLVDEVYPADKQERRNYLTRLEPYQDRQATLTAVDRVRLRELQVELEKAQQAQAVAVLDL